MRRVWALTSGDYSAYTVAAIFATRELAEAEVALNPDTDERAWVADGYEIEEFWLVESPPQDAVRLVASYPPSSVGYREYAARSWSLDHQEPCKVELQPTAYHSRPSWSLTVSGTDIERCRKVFSEERAQMLAMPWTVMPAEDLRRAVEAMDGSRIKISETGRYAITSDGRAERIEDL